MCAYKSRANSAEYQHKLRACLLALMYEYYRIYSYIYNLHALCILYYVQCTLYKRRTAFILYVFLRK